MAASLNAQKRQPLVIQGISLLIASIRWPRRRLLLAADASANEEKLHRRLISAGRQPICQALRRPRGASARACRQFPHRSPARIADLAGTPRQASRFRRGALSDSSSATAAALLIFG